MLVAIREHGACSISKLKFGNLITIAMFAWSYRIAAYMYSIGNQLPPQSVQCSKFTKKKSSKFTITDRSFSMPNTANRTICVPRSIRSTHHHPPVHENKEKRKPLPAPNPKKERKKIETYAHVRRCSMRWDSLQEYGRRSQQRGAGARRPGAAAEAAGPAAVASSYSAGATDGAAAPPAASAAPGFPDVREARRAEEHDEQERAQPQGTGTPSHHHRLLLLISQAIATLPSRLHGTPPLPAAAVNSFLPQVQAVVDSCLLARLVWVYLCATMPARAYEAGHQLLMRLTCTPTPTRHVRSRTPETTAGGQLAWPEKSAGTRCSTWSLLLTCNLQIPVEIRKSFSPPC